MNKLNKPKTKKEVLNRPALFWRALDVKTRKIIARDENFLRLSEKLKIKGIEGENIIFSPELGSGIWVL